MTGAFFTFELPPFSREKLDSPEMETIRLFKALTRDQRNTFIACFLGWALAALDFFLRHSPARVCFRISSRGNCLLAGLPAFWLARSFRRGGDTGASRSFHSHQGPGIAGLAATKDEPRREDIAALFANGPRALASFSLRDFAHDRVQLRVARHAGSLPDFPAKAVRPRCGAGAEREHHLQSRGNFWRDNFWRALATLGSSPYDHRGGGTGHVAHSGLDVFAQPGTAHCRRILHAVHGAGRVGRRPGALE